MGDDPDPQRRARQVRAFRDECDALAREGVFTPTTEQRAAIDAHHARLLGDLARQFDVDLNETQQSLSLGLRLTTIIGAVALSAATVLILRRFWGWLVLPAQVSVALAAPAVAFVALDWSARDPRRRLATGVLALVAFGAAVANVEILGSAFGFAPASGALLLYGLVAVGIAYAYDNRVMLVAGLCCLAAFAMTVPVALRGGWWMDALRRPESALVVGMTYIAVSTAATKRPEFAPWWRGVGCALVGLALQWLSVDGTATWLATADKRAVEVTYTLMAFAAGLIMIIAGSRRGYLGVSIGGAALILWELVLQYTNWWWRYVPQWLFFLVVGALALGAGLLLKSLRRAGANAR